MSEYFIGMDAGTTLIKSVLFDVLGNEIRSSKKNVPIESKYPGWNEQNMNQVWEAAKETLYVLVQSIDQSKDIINSISITGQGGGCWFIDKKGNPIRNAILWCDGRAKDVIEEWKSLGIDEEIYKICGTVQYSGLAGPIISWFKKNNLELLKKIHSSLCCKDWIIFNLTGQILSDASDSCLSFLDINEWEYDKKILEYMGIVDFSEILPKLQKCTEPVGYLQKRIKEEIGFQNDVKVIMSPFDMVSATIGAGAIREGDACSIVGTTCANEMIFDKPLIEPLNVGMTICHGMKGKYVRAMASMVGTPNLDWFLSQFCSGEKAEAIKNDKKLVALADQIVENIPVGSNGIIYHPYLSTSGERSPFVNEKARAQFAGLNQNHTRHDMLRSIYEGVAMSMVDCYSFIQQKARVISLSGGGSNSQIWCQIFADSLNSTIRVPKGTEFAAKGALINSLVALGIYKDYKEAISKIVSFKKDYYPNKENNNKYNKIYKVYRKIIENNFEIWSDLANI